MTIPAKSPIEAKARDDGSGTALVWNARYGRIDPGRRRESRRPPGVNRSMVRLKSLDAYRLPELSNARPTAPSPTRVAKRLPTPPV